MNPVSRITAPQFEASMSQDRLNILRLACLGLSAAPLAMGALAWFLRSKAPAEAPFPLPSLAWTWLAAAGCLLLLSKFLPEFLTTPARAAHWAEHGMDLGEGRIEREPLEIAKAAVFRFFILRFSLIEAAGAATLVFWFLGLNEAWLLAFFPALSALMATLLPAKPAATRVFERHVQGAAV